MIRVYLDHAYQVSVGGWFLVVGALYWRGHVKSAWRRMGFEHDIFKLFSQMKGSKTRVAMLNSLAFPKDRLQLARELGCDWNVADRHIRILLEHGLISEEKAYGKVKFYQLTANGKDLLELMKRFQEIR